MRRPDTRKVGPVVIQEITGPSRRIEITHEIDLPPMCPVSANPREGSVLELRYKSREWVLEVYALAALPDLFAGGFEGIEGYAPDRNMEGAIKTMVQMCADAIGEPVQYQARLNLDAGRLTLKGVELPQKWDGDTGERPTVERVP